MLNKNKRFNKIYKVVLGSKYTYIFLFLIILIQFFLVSIIFFQNKKSKYLIEQTNFRVGTIENKQTQLNKKIDSLQSNLSRIQVQLYRFNSQAPEQATPQQ